jgi:D-alanyl-D-alanine dipeptidase
VEANKEFIKKDIVLNFWLLSPLDIQKCEIVSNPKYVADPAKGSIHNRGGAVDITLVDANNRELDMGTIWFFFGKRPAMVMLNYQMKY